ncbi:MAG: hypothetical protein AB8B95_05825 [Pseudohongiellaceae bacterium]
MIRIITIALALLAITVLLASSISVLFPPQDASIQTSSGSAAERDSSIAASGNLSMGRPNRNGVSGSSPIGIAAIEATRSPMVESALESQVSSQLGEFIQELAVNNEQEAMLLDAFSQAYKDAAALGASKDKLNTQNQDPNFVVNAMGQWLEPDQLSELELYLENSSKRNFLKTTAPQVEILTGSLSPAVKQQLLDAYFEQHYAATNPHGSLAPQNSIDFLSAQLQALRATRTQLEASLPAAEFELVNKFLSEQEAGLDLGLGVFQSGQGI